MNRDQAIELLAKARSEMDQHHRAKHYLMWRSDNASDLGRALMATEPFAPLADLSILDENGKAFSAISRIGDWAIDKLVSRTPPETILADLAAELVRNRTPFVDVWTIKDVVIDAPCILSPKITVAPADDFLSQLVGQKSAGDLAEIRQPFTVAPAFVRSDQVGQVGPGTQTPNAVERAEALPMVRYACLLASAGPIDLLPLRTERDRDDLFTPPRFNEAVPNTLAAPNAHRISAAELAAIYAGLSKFASKEPLFRAIERLGRARRATDPIDQALELGIAVEVAMTHGDRSTAEIAFRLSTRLAWLLGKTADERQTVFKAAKALYDARSKAVHQGRLSSTSNPDLVAGDRLVTRALRALVERGGFPDWSALTMGAD